MQKKVQLYPSILAQQSVPYTGIDEKESPLIKHRHE